LSVQIARRVAGLPFSRGSAAALNKVLAALPPERQHQLRQLCRRIVVGSGASDDMRESAGEAPATLLDTFEGCFREGVCLSFRYVDGKGAATQRRVEPHGIFIRQPFWYILAVDVDKQAHRMFRMDRISNPRAIARRFVPSFEVVEELMGDDPYTSLRFDPIPS
jgi:predicted DNA-binding transcriptional regulator YafY